MTTPQQRDLLTSIPAAPTTEDSVPFTRPTGQLEGEMWLIRRMALQFITGEGSAQRAYVAQFFAGTTTIAHRAQRVREAMIEQRCGYVICGRFRLDGPALTYEQVFEKLYGAPLSPKQRTVEP
jgi:hypothetical protein